MSAHSNPHWTTGIIFVYYFFGGMLWEAFYLNKLSYFFPLQFKNRGTCIPEQYGMSAHSNPHWTTGIIFVYYFFGGALVSILLSKLSYFC